MKYSSCAFLARAHIKSGRRSTSVFVLLLLSIVLLTLVLSFASTMNRVIDTYQNQDATRRIYIDSAPIDLGYTPLTNAVLTEVAQMEHVESVDQIDGTRSRFFNIQALLDEREKNCNNMLPAPLENSVLEMKYLYSSQKMHAVAGEMLDTSPTFSCLFPSVFYAADDVDLVTSKLNFQDGTQYIGKTVTIKPCMDSYDLDYFVPSEEGGFYTETWHLPALEYKLKVIGVYNASFDNGGGPNTIYVSYATAMQMQEMAIQATKDPNFIAEYEERKENPVLHSYTVLIDEYEHMDQVIEQLENRKIAVSSVEQFIPDSVQLLSAVFTGAGNFLTFAILVLAVVNLFLSVSGALADRKGEVG
ncbi:MAG: hypothetical protein U0M23_01555, partial [Acutalibacteraceae bacterium]|nr:hypothetical protein [Acutalibacteraceae bacterium]